jgi:glycine/D-amino acid oxidase-like deaminating enzyme
MELKSPWLHQFAYNRPVTILQNNLSTDICIVGGGIAGIVTAYFILEHTDLRVVLLEGSRVAAGATGHNGGQLVSYFERPFAELVHNFGLPLVSDAQRSVESAWDLLEAMRKRINPTAPIQVVMGYAGCTTEKQVVQHLTNNWFRVEGGLHPEEVWIADDAPFLYNIPKKFNFLSHIVPRAKILEHLETDNSSYVALLAYQKGCMNSAWFTEETATFLLQTYPGRFQLFEHTIVDTVNLLTRSATVETGGLQISAPRVVLCTNGFENFTINNLDGLPVDPTFHHSVEGVVGYMAAYLEPRSRGPAALSYLHTPDATGDEPYMYLTRREFSDTEHKNTTLTTIGGPEVVLPEDEIYSDQAEYPKEKLEELTEFLQTSYTLAPKTIVYDYVWHGLMGYTHNGVRLIGFEPINPVLLYNLGCNGVGLLPSIYGGKRISQLLNNESPPPSLFDPVHPPSA